MAVKPLKAPSRTDALNVGRPQVVCFTRFVGVLSWPVVALLPANNVSHANNKTRRRYLPNLQVASLLSEALGQSVRLRLSTNAIRTVDAKGGIDAFLLDSKDAELNTIALRLKRRIRKAIADKVAA